MKLPLSERYEPFRQIYESARAVCRITAFPRVTRKRSHHHNYDSTANILSNWIPGLVIAILASRSIISINRNKGDSSLADPDVPDAVSFIVSLTVRYFVDSSNVRGAPVTNVAATSISSRFHRIFYPRFPSLPPDLAGRFFRSRSHGAA